MFRYMARRLLFGILVLVGASTITFAISHLIPGDPVTLAAGFDAAPETIAAIRKEYGFDRSVPEQYFVYVRSLLRGDLGYSIATRRRVADDLRVYLPATIGLTLSGATIAVTGAAFLGTLSALHSNQLIDHVGRVVSVLGAATPQFWGGLILQLVFYKVLGVLPATGRLEVGVSPPPTVTGLYTIDSLLVGDLGLFVDAVRHLILPSFVLSWQMLAILSRTLRSCLLEVLNRDYIRVAHAKGLSQRTVTWRHAMPNALIPVVTVFGTFLGML